MQLRRTSVMNFDNALRGARNPMNSWHKADSYWEENIDGVKTGRFIIGQNDLDLAQRLVRGGSEHRKFMRQIFVSVDITAPLYWWKEYDTYKVGTVANSTSTMHKISAKEFELDDFSYEHLTVKGMECLGNVIKELNEQRDEYNSTTDPDIKRCCWWQMIQLLPTSYNQTRTLTLNYENIYSMIRQRQHHKLDEWRVDFINWCHSLPYANELLFLDLED